MASFPLDGFFLDGCNPAAIVALGPVLQTERDGPRTLTNLYNQRPAWLDLAHQKLDEAVFAASGWSPGISDDELLGKLLELNLSRASA